MSAAKPFDDLTVVDLAWVVAGPAIGRTLADYGATVIRVESRARPDAARLIGPYHDGKIDLERCALFDTFNAGKLGLTLDLRQEAAQGVLFDLIKRADVLIESFAPGRLAQWGLTWDRLHAENPALILLSTSLMGQSGPFRSFAGFGNLGAAVSGFQGLAGESDAIPIGPFGPYTDYVGPRFALVALLAALEHRRQTGKGCHLDVSQAEAGIQFLAPAVSHAADTGQNAAAMGNRDPQYAPHGVYQCAGEDEWVAIVARSDREWQRLAEVIGASAQRDNWKTLKGRKADEDALDDIVGSWARLHHAQDIEQSLQRLGIPAHKVASAADVVNDPQLIARQHFVRLPHPLGGESIFDATRYRLSDTPARYDRVAPHYGRDNLYVLKEILGYDDDRIAALHADEVLR